MSAKTVFYFIPRYYRKCATRDCGACACLDNKPSRSIFDKERIKEFYTQALELEPQMLINYLIKEIVLFDDKIEIHYNSPIRISPDDSQGFSFYSKTIQINAVQNVIITMMI